MLILILDLIIGEKMNQNVKMFLYYQKFQNRVIFQELPETEGEFCRKLFNLIVAWYEADTMNRSYGVGYFYEGEDDQIGSACLNVSGMSLSEAKSIIQQTKFSLKDFKIIRLDIPEKEK